MTSDDLKPKFDFYVATEHLGFDDRDSFVPIDLFDFAREVHHGPAGDEHLPAFDIAFGEPCAQSFVRDASEKFDFEAAERLEVPVILEDSIECNEIHQAFADGGWIPFEDEIAREHGADLFVPSAAITLKSFNGEKHNFRGNPGEEKPTNVRGFAFLSGGDLKDVPGIHDLLYRIPCFFPAVKLNIPPSSSFFSSQFAEVTHASLVTSIIFLKIASSKINFRHKFHYFLNA